MDGGAVNLKIDETDRGPLAHLVIDHLRRRNAIGPAVISALTEEARTLSERADIRAVTLRGAGGIFASGANVKVMRTLDQDGARAFITSLHDAIDAIRRLPVPVICVLQGHCYGAAMELAAACDMRLADHSLVSGMPEVRVGIPSVIQANLLPRLIGWGKTSELLLTGRDVVGAENRDIGFVERYVSPNDLDNALSDWTGAILGCAPAAVRAQKVVMRGWESDERPGVAASIDAFAASYGTGE
ncbi:MAG: enoyl-CoA hydratase-related protein, partial [Pseudomonadota bacterium]